MTKHAVRLTGLAWLVVAATLAASCGGSESPTATEGSSTAPEATASASTTGSAETASTFTFPTGPAVMVPAGYEPPGDIVDSTGAHLPANGKPTLVYVDAIW